MSNHIKIIDYIQKNEFIHSPLSINPKKIRLFKYQKKLIEDFEKNDKIMVAKSRQIGLTTLLIFYAAYKANIENKKILFFGYHTNLPFFRDKIKKLTIFNEDKIIFKNTINSLIGFNCDIAILDEAAFNGVDSFFPEGVCKKLIICSTPKKYSWFNELYKEKSNQFYKINLNMLVNEKLSFRDIFDSIKTIGLEFAKAEIFSIVE